MLKKKPLIRLSCGHTEINNVLANYGKTIKHSFGSSKNEELIFFKNIKDSLKSAEDIQHEFFKVAVVS